MEPFIVGMGLKMPRFRIPFIIFYIYALIVEMIAWLAGLIGIRMRLDFTRLALHAVTTKHVYSWEAIRKYADYEPLFSYEESIERTLVWWSSQNNIKQRYLDQ
jgi:hypothetical protein